MAPLVSLPSKTCYATHCSVVFNVSSMDLSEVAVILPSTSAGNSAPAPASPATPTASRSHNTPRSSGMYTIVLHELNLGLNEIKII